jgi:predicted GNAT superfamily acetyltransferase
MGMGCEEAAGEAFAEATGVARRCGVDVVAPLAPDQQREAASLLARVWQLPSPDPLMSPALIRALEYSGNYVAGAYRDGVMVGAALGFFGRDHLHSDLVGVAHDSRGSGVGYAIKQHQRAWALSCGLPEVRWTFDPLLRRNAYFNLRKLGARAVRYLPDFYGTSGDSDRLYIRWELRTPAAGRGEQRAAVLLDRVDGAPVPGGPPTGGPLLVAMPDDIDALRASDPALAARWRTALRDALTGALAAGYEIADALPDGYYLLKACVPAPPAY